MKLVKLLKFSKLKILLLFVLLLNITIFIILTNLIDDQKDLSASFDNRIHNLKKIKACIFILAKNGGLKDLINTITQFDNKFNHKYNYPYVLINDEEFTLEFKETIVKHTKSLVEFGKVPTEQWKIPDWINKTELEFRFNTSLKNLRYGTQMSYHHMCRYFSGFFFKHKLTLKYDYYLRIDPHVEFPCKIEYNPFEVLVNLNKLYGFVITRSEQMKTIPTLWKTINQWLDDNNYLDSLPKDNSLMFLSNDNGITINDCHFWNNFEMGSFSIFRNNIYQSYFDYLDKRGGFYYERWGDAPVHSYFVILMLKKSQIHRFYDISYGHSGIFNWPLKNIKNRCDRSRKMTIVENGNCTNHWDLLSIFD